jgi:hypothetical protein
MNGALSWSVAPVLLLAAFAAAAQMPGGGRRSRSDQPPDMQQAPRQGALPQSLRLADPVIALERELPSLRTDLALNPDQQALWGPFERGIRDAAELSRQRLKKMMAARSLDAPAPNAADVVSAFAADDRMRADATAFAASRLKALYEALTPEQRSLLDRRVLLSQSEPLGTQ